MQDEAEDKADGGGLIGWFIRNPVAANLLMVVLLFGGFLSASSMKSQVFPTIDPGIISVSVPYPGATPAEVEEGITRRVEEAVLGIDGVDKVTSVASENIGTVTIEVSDFVDKKKVKDDVETAVEQLAQFPPENAERFSITAADPTEQVVTLVVTGNQPPLVLRRAAETLERDLLTEDGISLVSLSGDRDYEISIEVSEDTLRNYGLSFDEVAQAVRSSSLDLAGGSLITQSGEFALRVSELRETGDEFETIVVRNQADGSQILLSDVANVVDGFTREQVTNTYNGQPAIFVDISRAQAEDVLGVKEAVDAYLATYTPPEGIEILEFRDQTAILAERLNLLLRNALIGFILVFVFLILMLDLKLAVWVCIGITTAFLGGFMLFDAAGVTITMVSTFGLIVVLGLVVDDAIVIGENIDAQREEGFEGREAAIRGVSQVFSPVLVGVMTTLAAFSPLLFVSGTFSDIARAIPTVVICVLIISLVEAFFILPSHLSHAGTWSRGPVKFIQWRVAKRLGQVSDYIIQPGVSFLARWRYATVGGAAAFAMVCFGLASSGIVKFVFFPSIEGNEISATVTMPEGTPFERTEAAVRQLEKAAIAIDQASRDERGEPLFLSVAVTAGGQTTLANPNDAGGFSQIENVGQVQIELVPFGARRTDAAEIERRWKEELGRIPGIERISFNADTADFGNDVEYELAAQDESVLIDAAETLKSRLALVDGVEEIEDSFDLGKRQLIFKLTDAGRAAGLQPADVARQVRQAFFGDEVQRIQRGREEVRVFVRYPESTRQSLDALEEFRIRLPDGGEIPLYTVADIEESRSFSSIQRIDGRQVVTVTADIDEDIVAPTAANEEIQTDILPDLVEQYPGLRWTQAGAGQEQTQDLESLAQAFLIVLVIIYALVATQLRSYLQPIAILISIPLGVAGAILGHYVLGYALSFPSIFGIVALSGVAVNASVVLIDLYNVKRREGVEPIEAMAEASARRFRPILLTTLTTALGLGPLLLETSPQAQFLIPMGVSLGFGIVISGFMVIFVTPAVALIVEDLRVLPRKIANLTSKILALINKVDETKSPAE
ncbi:MAG: efflux RND transporter permease subunit [Pseudomonadota bacterium]